MKEYLEKLEALPDQQKYGIVAAIIAVMAGAFWYFVYAPNVEKIGQLTEEIRKLDAEITKGDAMRLRERELEAELVRENERVMREQLAADALRFRTNPPSNTPGPTANPPPENPDPSQVAEAAIAPKTHDAPAQTPRPFSRIAAVAGLATAVAAAIVAVLLRARSRA